MNNFDYTSVPGELLYEERQHLDDFNVDDESSQNYLIESKLADRFSHFTSYEDFLTRLFNCAYYICTMALADSHPERRFGVYLRKAGERVIYRADYSGVILAIVLIQIRVHKWDKQRGMSRLAGSIEKELTNKVYGDIYQTICREVLQEANDTNITLLPESEFRPREITMGVLKRACNNLDLKRRFGTDMDKMLEFIFAIGKNEDEQNLIASFLQEQTHSSFTNGAEHKYCFDSIERKIYLKYHADEENAKIEAEIEEDLMKEYEQQWQLDYYKDEYQKLKAENSQLLAKVKEQKEHTADESNLSTDAQKTIEEQAQTIDELRAELEHLKVMNEVLTNQNERSEKENPDMDIDEDTALTIKESIIFFSSILDCNLNKEDISQTNLARLISKFTKWPRESIRPKIVDINTEREDNAKNHTAFSDGVHQAAVNVCALIENAMEGVKKNQMSYSCKQALENIHKIYQSPGCKIEPHEIAEAKKNLKKT